MWRRLLLIAVLAVAASPAVQDPGLPATTWTIENDTVAAVYGWYGDGSFRLTSFTDKRNGRTWAASPQNPAAAIQLGTDTLQLNSQTAYFTPSGTISDIDNGGKRLTIVLQPVGADVQVILEAEVYGNFAFLRQRYRFQNAGSKSVNVTSADFLAANFYDGNQTYRSFHVGQWGSSDGDFATHETDLTGLGAPLFLNSGAFADHCSWVAIRDAQDSGLAIGWEFNGRAQMSLWHDAGSASLKLEGSVEGLAQSVDPGQEFAAPAVFFGSFTGDWDEAGYRTQRFVERAMGSPMPDRPQFPYLAWDSWGYQDQINEALLRRAADVASGLGVELFTVDMGWAKALGDWHADPVKFPSGLRALSDYVHAKGMKFGVHFPLTEADANSPILQQHPDWTTSTPDGFFGAYSLCPSHEPAKQWIISEALRVVQEYNVDWLLQDGVNMVQECTRTTHTHASANSNYSNAVHGIDEIVAAIRSQAPQVSIENCESGGRMMTYQMVRNYTTSIASDNSDELTTRNAIYGASFPFPPRYIDRYMGPAGSTFSLRSGMVGGGPWILMGQLSNWSEADISRVAGEVAFYKSTRLLIRNSKMFHLSPPPDGLHNEVYESYNRPMNSAVIFVFRMESDQDQEHVTPLGLRPDSEYVVKLQEAGTATASSGRTLMDHGFDVPLPTQNFAEIIQISPVQIITPPAQ
ncbi:MAG TPA: alpha-galactosidase [Bryobacterales bacterium]|nr:alpha-galactosidase [Bryobacterales bacterium]